MAALDYNDKGSLEVDTTTRCPGYYQFRCLWTIQDYKQQWKEMEDGDFISTTFVFGGRGKIYSIKLSLYKTLSENNEYVGVYLELDENSDMLEMWAEYEASIVKSDGSLFNSSLTSLSHFCENSWSWGYTEFIMSNFADDNSDGYLPGGCLKLLFKGTIWSERVKEINIETRENVSWIGGYGNVGSLLSSAKFSDIILSVGDKQFSTHKNILSAGSQVFDDMFSQESKESFKNVIEIPDVESEVFQEVLHFIYNDRCTPMLDKLVAKVFPVANHYKVDILKNICELKMISELSVENCIQYFTLANQQKARNLIKVASLFMKDHFKEITNSNQWVTLQKENPMLVNFIESIFNTE